MNHLLDKLAAAARVLKLGQALPDGELSWEVVQRVQADFAHLVEEAGISLQQVSAAMGEGYSRGTLSRWRNLQSAERHYMDVDRITRGVNQWLETIARRAHAKVTHGWVETNIAKRMMLVISKTIELCSIGIIVGDAGRGKSMTLQAGADMHPGSILLRVTRATATPKGLLTAFCRALNMRLAKSIGEMELRLIDRLRGTGRALLIDEAHQLKPDTLELVRDLHDECGVPIVLCGTIRLTDITNDPNLFFGQFNSRVAITYNVNEALAAGDTSDPRPLHSPDEIRRLWESDRVRLTTDGREFLARLANLPGLGGLRLCAKILQVAEAASDGALIDQTLLMKVISTLRGRSVAQACIDRVTERRNVMAG